MTRVRKKLTGLLWPSAWPTREHYLEVFGPAIVQTCRTAVIGGFSHSRGQCPLGQRNVPPRPAAVRTRAAFLYRQWLARRRQHDDEAAAAVRAARAAPKPEPVRRPRVEFTLLGPDPCPWCSHPVKGFDPTASVVRLELHRTTVCAFYLCPICQCPFTTVDVERLELARGATTIYIYLRAGVGEVPS